MQCLMFMWYELIYSYFFLFIINNVQYQYRYNVHELHKISYEVIKCLKESKKAVCVM